MAGIGFDHKRHFFYGFCPEAVIPDHFRPLYSATVDLGSERHQQRDSGDCFYASTL
jgi:hypothetical protein